MDTKILLVFSYHYFLSRIFIVDSYHGFLSRVFVLVSNIEAKEWLDIINVSKAEATYLREHGAHITVLNKYANARKKKWLAEESRETARLLRLYRSK